MDKLNPSLLIKFRKKTGLTQKEFADCIGIKYRTYRSYEDGSRGLSFEKFQDFKYQLGYLKNADNERLEVHIDYLRITFMSVRDLKHFCHTYLHCELNEFTEFDTKLLNYTHLWKRGNIWIFDFFDRIETGNNQITLQLSGQGCREMELILETHHLTWQDLLQKMFYEIPEMRVRRLDIALDERYLGRDREEEQFFLSDMISKVYKREVLFRNLRTWNYIGGGSLREFDEREGSQGISIYFGSRKSNLYFNFYEKRYELAKIEQISLEKSLEIFGIWNRYEIRFAREKAQLAIEEYINGVDLAEISRGVINHELEVYDGTNRYGAYQPDLKWQRLFGGVAPLRLRMKPEPYTIERTIRWLMYQVSNSLRLVNEADKIMNTEYLKTIQNCGEINERGEAILNDLKASHYLLINKGEQYGIQD